MRLFFYGTLLDPDVRSLVLGRPVPLSPARLDGWRRATARGRSFPIILRQPNAAVEGGVTPPLPASALGRLKAYEGPEYTLVRCRPQLAAGGAVAAGVFRPAARLIASSEPWELAAWQVAAKPRYIEILRRGGGHG